MGLVGGGGGEGGVRRGVAVRVMAATAAVMAGARLGIVLLTFGMTPVLVLLVMAPKGGGLPGVGGGEEGKV